MHAVDRADASGAASPPLLCMLHQTADRHPGRPAIVFGDEVIAWAELVERTERLARGLSSLGIAEGDRVALVHPNAPEFVETFFAVTALGAVVVPLNPQYQVEELRHYLADCDVRAVIADPRHVAACRSALAGREHAVVVATGDAPSDALPFQSLVDGHANGLLPASAGAADAVYQYSSGSTGRPKRVARTHEQCRWEAVNFVETTGLGPDDRVFCAIPLFHTHGQGNCMLAAACSGAALVILEDANPFILKRERALEVLARQRATVFPGVPFVFRLLAELPDDADLSALRLCFSAGTALPLSTFEGFVARFGVPVRQLYGCTEAGSLTINLDRDPRPTALSVGGPMRRVRVQVVDDARRPVPTGDVGEIAISTPAMTRGYHQMEDHNREVFRDGFFFTGDLGRLDGDGRLWITGRKKLFIEVAGNKVDPLEVEDVLATHPRVREVVVVGVPGKAPGEEIVKAVVVPAEPVDKSELVALCRERLALFKVPRVIEFRDEIPKSPLGKVLRKYLV
jgi:long-chain acyl-CoA synthetase